MLISKFNTMIRNRWVWAFFAIVVSVSFVGAFSEMEGCTAAPQNQNLAGRLDGEPVTLDEFRQQRFHVLGLRDVSTRSNREETELRARTWQRIAALRMTRRLGLGTSDRELAENIHRDPSFQENGVFDARKYNAILQQQLRVLAPTFEAFLREEISLQKLGRLFESAAWTAPTELVRRLANLMDSFTVDYVVLTPANTGVSATPDDDEVRAFYDENRERFATPPLAAVRYVRFPVADHTNRAESAVDEAAVRDYYDEHPEEFRITGTNNEEVLQPFEDVSVDIRSLLVTQAAVEEARNEATLFAVALTPERDGVFLDFDKAAAARNLPVATTELFSVTQVLTNLLVGRDFNRAAFELDGADPERYFSDAIVGDEHVYVIATNTVVPSRIPAFEEISALVRAAATTNALRKAFAARVDELHSNAVARTATGASFHAVLAEAGLPAATSVTFSAYQSMSDEFTYSDALVPAVIGLDAGAVADPVEAEEGVLLVYVAAREPADPFSLELPKSQLLGALSRFRGNLVYRDWQKNLLAAMQHEDLLTPLDADAPAEDEEYAADAEAVPDEGIPADDADAR